MGDVTEEAESALTTSKRASLDKPRVVEAVPRRASVCTIAWQSGLCGSASDRKADVQ